MDTHAARPDDTVAQDIQDLHQFGYQQTLRRTIGGYTSFALAFSMITITTTIFTLFTDPFTKVGGVGIWLWFPVTLALLSITLVYAHLSVRLPVTGYAYQWSSRIVNRDYGWFSGWTALVSFFAGTASIAVSFATVFAGYIWSNPSQANIVLLAGVALAAAVVVNIVSIRAATFVNNIGASTELLGTMGLTLLTFIALFFFKDKQGPAILFQTGAATGGHLDLVTFGLAALLPIYTLLGWEGAADLAEETHNPRRTAPRAMIRSVLVSGVAGFFVYAVFAMAIPHGVKDTVNQTQNPLIYVFQSHFGGGPALVLKVVAFVSIFSALLANVTVATRMCYALARDKMIPGWQVLGYVSPRTRTPVYAIVLVGLIALLVNLLSAGVIAAVAAIVAVTYYGTYLLTCIAAILGDRRGSIPAAPAGYFGLGRWLRPLAVVGIAWSLLVIADMTLPPVNNIAGEYTVVAEVLGVAWYALYLRRRLRSGEAGPPLASAAPPTIETRDEVRIAGESV